MDLTTELSMNELEASLTTYSTASAPQAYKQTTGLGGGGENDTLSHTQLNPGATAFTPNFSSTPIQQSTRSNTLSSIATTPSSCHCHTSPLTCQTSCALYSNLPLPTPTKISPSPSIRLLVVKPGSPNSPLDCLLFTHSLVDSTKFTALSYVWGEAYPRSPLLVNNTLTSVGANLFSVLIQLRRSTEHVTLWVDALCINQNNLSERASQVQFMPEIYRAADQVVAWLGSSSPFSDLAMSYIGAHGSRKAAQTPILPSSVTSEIRIALDDLWSRQYWTRVWVVQELASARRSKNACLFRCGSKEVSYEVLRRFLANYLRCVPFTGGDPILEPRRMLTLSSHAPSMTFLEVLWEGARLQAGDPRDRIFGIRGISPGFYRDTIKVDYVAGYRQICRRFMVQYVKKEKSLDTLCYFHGFPSGNRTPSWICDLETRNSGLSPFVYWASGKRVAEVKIVGDVLVAKGVRIGIVERKKGPYERVSVFNHEVAVRELEDLRSEALAVLKQRYSKESNESRENRLWNMVGGQHESPPDLPPPSSTTPPIPHPQSWLPSSDTIEETRRNLNIIFKHAINRSFFTTSNGYIGLGPPDLLPDDLICVLYGCSVCIVLRQMRNEKGWKFVGPAYVDGAMSGELVKTNMDEDTFQIY